MAVTNSSFHIEREAQFDFSDSLFSIDPQPVTAFAVGPIASLNLSGNIHLRTAIILSFQDRIINYTFYKDDTTEVFDKKVDIITMFHVLEHLPSQVRILKILREKLKSGGKIVIEIPHANDVLISKIKLKKFLDFTFISEHLILHTSSSIKKVLIHSGFKNIKIKYFQRHNLDNFLYWIMTGRPGGHNKFQISSKKSKINFEKYLIKNKITDTLIVTAEK